jgi:hypothetical protein
VKDLLGHRTALLCPQRLDAIYRFLMGGGFHLPVKASASGE